MDPVDGLLSPCSPASPSLVGKVGTTTTRTLVCLRNTHYFLNLVTW